MGLGRRVQGAALRTVEEILLEQHERRMAAVRALPPDQPSGRPANGQIPATVTEGQLAAIRKFRTKGMVYRVIAERVGVSISTVSLVLSGKKRSGVSASHPPSGTP